MPSISKSIVALAAFALGLITCGLFDSDHFLSRLRDGGAINVARDAIEKMTLKPQIHEGCVGPVSFNKYAVSVSDFDRRIGQRYDKAARLFTRPLDTVCIANFYGEAGQAFWADRGDVTARFVKLKSHRLGKKFNCNNEAKIVAELEDIGRSEYKMPLAFEEAPARVPEVYYEIKHIKEICGDLAPYEGDRLIKRAFDLGYQDRRFLVFTE